MFSISQLLKVSMSLWSVVENRKSGGHLNHKETSELNILINISVLIQRGDPFFLNLINDLYFTNFFSLLLY